MKRLLFLLTLLTVSGGAFARDKDCRSCDCPEVKKGLNASRFKACDERKPAFERRIAGACLRTLLQQNYDIERENNSDQKFVPDFAANYSKLLEHDDKGILTCDGQESYKTLLRALKNGKQATYNSLDLADETEETGRKLVSPQTSASFSYMGTDSSLIPLPLFSKLKTEQAAAQILEVYLQAIARDVLFEEYGTGDTIYNSDTDPNGGGSITKKAGLVLDDFGACYEGPTDMFGEVTPEVLFRGNNNGAIVGPYISQFLYFPLSIPSGTFPPAVGLDNLILEIFKLPQKYPIATKNRNFGITKEAFAAIQNGGIPQSYQESDYNVLRSQNRFIISGRDLSSSVHFDLPAEFFYNATRILLTNGFPLCPSNPYVNGMMPNEETFGTLGPAAIIALIEIAMQEAVKAAWAHKWRAQRVLRPEAFGGLIQVTKDADKNCFCLSKAIFKPHNGIDVLEWVQFLNANNDPPADPTTCLMPLAYPEGSPAHPSYPAGHSVISGAAMTIVKAFFDDTILFNTVVPPVQPEPGTDGQVLEEVDAEIANKMTVGGELEKLASNNAIGRNFAGIHYRADGDNGILLGESVAIKVLQDHAATLTEQKFTGFELTKVDGTRIRITAKCVEEICS